MRPRRVLHERPLAALFAMLGIVACESTRADHGLRVVENALASSWQSTGEWTLEEDLRLRGPPAGHFGTVGSVAADSRDNILVLDALAQEIHVFDSEGVHQRTFGGEGEGPGEFRMANALTLAAGDTLWVVDPMTRRYSVFGPDGGFVRGMTRRINSGESAGRCAFEADGSHLDWAVRFPNEERTGNFSDIDLIHYHPVRVSPDGERQDTLPTLEFIQQMAEMPSMGLRRPVQFGAGLARAFDCAGGLWFAHTGDYRLYRRSLEGDTTLVATLDALPAQITEADRDEIRDRFASRPDLAADYLSTLPASKPIIDRLLVDGEGHVLVMPETARAKAGTAIDVFRDDGVFVGRLAVPETATLARIRAGYATTDYLLFAGEDAAGMPIVTRLRIRR